MRTRRVSLEASVALVFRPTWSWIEGSSISDYDVALHYHWSYLSASARYRWFECGDSGLNGVFIGVSARL